MGLRDGVLFVLAWVAWVARLHGRHASVGGLDGPLAWVVWVASLHGWCGWRASLDGVGGMFV